MQKGILTLSNAIWNAKRRYKVNSVVKFGNSVYQNSTGRNSSPDLLTDWVLIKDNVSGTTQLRRSRQIYTSGAQEFTLPEAAAQIVLVTVNGGVVYDYTILSDTLVRIDLTLVPTVRVVIHYLVDLNLGAVPYYTQAQIDAMLPAGSNKTKGSVTATDDPGNDAILEFDLNEVLKPTDGRTVVLPTTTEIGKEIYVFALNNSAEFYVQANQDSDNKLSGINGINGVTDAVAVEPNQSYRFIHRQNGYWFYELIESTAKNLQAVMDNGRTYNGNFYGVDCVLRFFETADGVVFSEFYTEHGGIRNEISFGTVQVALKSGTTQLYLRDEDFKIEKKQTTIGIDDSQTSIVTAINFPAKAVAGDYKVVVQPSTTYTVATLPAGVLGDIAIVTDALSPAYATTVVGGGSVTIKVWYNGTNWVCN